MFGWSRSGQNLLIFVVAGAVSACTVTASLTETGPFASSLLYRSPLGKTVTSSSSNDHVATNDPDIRLTASFTHKLQSFRPDLVTLQNATFTSFETIDAQSYVLHLHPVAEGVVRLKLQAGAGIDSSGAASEGSDWIEFAYDITPPTLSALSSAPASPSQIGQPLIEGTAEPGASVALFTTSACSGSAVETGSADPSSGTFSVTSPTLTGDGTKTFSVLATDAAGNTTCTAADLSYVYDTTPPVPVVLLPADGAAVQASAVLSGLCEDGLPLVISGPGVASDVTTSCGPSGFSVTVPLSSGDGTKTLTLTQTDAAGNVGTATFHVVRDETPPSLAIASPAAGTAAQTSLVLTGSCEAGLTVHIAGTGVDTPTDTTCTAGSFSQAINFSTGEGTKLVVISQGDAAGNTGTDSRSFTRDNTPPSLAITAPATNARVPGSFTLTGTCETASGTVTISGAGAASTVTASCAAGVFSATVSATSGDGAKTFEADQTDAAGNIGSATITVQNDLTAPSAPSISLVNGAVEDNPVAVTLSSCADGNESSTNYAGLLWVVDSAATPSLADAGWGACAAGPKNLTLSGDGAHTIRAWARDAAGNLTSSNVVTVTLDTTAPTWTTVVSSAVTQRNATGTIAEASIQASEEGSGTYSLLTPTLSPKCSDYGSVSVNAANGAITFVPTTNYYNVDSGTNYNGGPCHVLVQFADAVSPTPHTVTKDITYEVDWANGTNNTPNVSAWPGANGTATEHCGSSCYANSTVDFNFTADPGGGAFLDPQNLTCTASSADSYYVDVQSCTILAGTGTLSLDMGNAHPGATDATTITITVSDGIDTVTKTFAVHVDNYVVSMYPAMATRASVSCLLCHANVNADLITDFGVPSTQYSNASAITGFARLAGTALYHELNDGVPFSISGSVYIPDITVTDPNFMKQISGSPTGSVSLASWLVNTFTFYDVTTDVNGAPVADTDGTVKLSGTTSTRPAVFDPARVPNGVVTKSSVTIRAPSDAEIINLSRGALTLASTGFVYQGPSAKPTLSGLEVKTYGAYGDGDHKFVQNNGTIVCYGTVIISGPLYLKNPDIQTDDNGCSIYVAGNVYIETNRSQAIQYLGGASNPTLQLSSSQNVVMGIGLYSQIYRRGIGGTGQAQRIVNLGNPGALQDAGPTSVKTNNAADSSFWYQTCPLMADLAYYLDGHYVSDGNYLACQAGYNCGYGDQAFGGYHGAVSGYDHEDTTPLVYNGTTLVSMLRAYETMCRLNGGVQNPSYSSGSWNYTGFWGESPSTYNHNEIIDPLRQSTLFTHFRVNGASVQSRYYGTFNGSVISPYALFAIGNLVFTYDTGLNSIVPYPRLMNPIPIFDVH